VPTLDEEIASLTLDNDDDGAQLQWTDLTVDGRLLNCLKSLVAKGIENWDQVREAWNTWAQFCSDTYPPYQWLAGQRLIELAELAVRLQSTGSEADKSGLLRGYPWEWDAFCALRGQSLDPIEGIHQSLSVLFNQGETGILMVLHVELIPDGSGKIYPDAEHNAFIEIQQTPDEDGELTFRKAYEQAWEWAKADTAREDLDSIDARFWLDRVSMPDGDPDLEELKGPSAQAAFYLCLHHAALAYLETLDTDSEEEENPSFLSKLFRRQTGSRKQKGIPRLDPSVAVTAELNEERCLGKVSGLDAKMEVAYKSERRTVIVAKGIEKAAEEALLRVAPDGTLPVLGSETAQQAAEKAAAPQDDQDRLALLDAFRKQWIRYLERSKPPTGWLPLRLKMEPDAVETPWDGDAEHPDAIPQIRPPDSRHQREEPEKTLQERLWDIFEATKRKLLILGDAGAGKTIGMLMIADKLVKRADAAPSEPIPVHFFLLTWPGGPLLDWLVDELNTKYGYIPKKMGRRWLGERRLILLLDELDQVPQSKRADCIRAINEFQRVHRPPGIIVSCRYQAYLDACQSEREANRVLLKLGGAVRLLPLTPEQVNSYFAEYEPRYDGLRHAVKDDRRFLFAISSLRTRDTNGEEILEELRHTFEHHGHPLSDDLTVAVEVPSRKWILNDEGKRQYFTVQWSGNQLNVYDRNLLTLAQSPLMLFVMSLAYQDLPPDDPAIQGLDTATLEDARQHIFKTYARRMRQRRGCKHPYSQTETSDWLRWLARNLKKHTQSIFMIEQLQPSCLSSRWERRFYTLGYCLMIILIGALIGTSIGGIGVLFRGYFTLHLPIQSVLIGAFLYGVVQLLIFFGIDMAREYFNLGRGMRHTIQPVEALNKWSLEKAAEGLMVVVFLAIVGLIKTYVGGEPSDKGEWIRMLALGVPLTICSGFRGKALGAKEKIIPNQGIYLSLKNAARGALIGGFSTMLIAVPIGLLDRTKTVVGLLQSSGIFGAIQGGLWYGGMAVIRHYVLRFILIFKRYTPPKYADFLNYTERLIFLHKVGGGYIFYHRMLLDYFAAMSVEEEIEMLTIHLNDEDPKVRAAAVRRLGELNTPNTVPPLISALEDRYVIGLEGRYQVSDLAVHALAKIGAPAVPELINILSKKYTGFLDRKSYIDLLEKIGVPVSFTRSDKLENVNYHCGVPERAARALGEMGEVAQAAKPVLVKATRHRSDFIRINAIEALAKIDRSYRDMAVSLLINDLMDKRLSGRDWSFSIFTIGALQRIGTPEGLEAVEAYRNRYGLVLAGKRTDSEKVHLSG
jgi:hypothetical protein